MAAGYYSKVLVVYSNGSGLVSGFAVNEVVEMIARILPET